MGHARRLVALALLAFALAFLARLPARWLPKLLPAGVVCIEPAGTLWNGSCTNFEASGLRAGAVSWSLRPLRLFTGRVAARLQLAQPLARLQGEFAWSLFGGALEARDLRGELVLAPGGLLPGVPADLGGRVTLALQELALRDRAVRNLRGTIDVQDLQQRTGEGPMQLGSYQLGFDGGEDENGAVRGKLRDTGGPLDVAGTLALTPAPGYLLQGTVATRPSASSLLQRQIAFLGSPDAAGRRAFAQEATF